MKPKEIELHLLQILGSEEAPLGAGGASEKLRRKNIDISEATAGRHLKNLERQGLAVKIGGKGRTLSPEGRARLDFLLQEREENLSAQRFLTTLCPIDSHEIIEVLLARRTIEGECACLAARNGKPADVKKLREIVNEMNRRIREGEDLAPLDEEFHGHLASMSGNRVLQSTLEVIRQNGRRSPLLQTIRRHAGRLSGEDHRVLLEAVEKRNGRAAGAAMTRHIDNVLEDVKLYFAQREPH